MKFFACSVVLFLISSAVMVICQEEEEDEVCKQIRQLAESTMCSGDSKKMETAYNCFEECTPKHMEVLREAVSFQSGEEMSEMFCKDSEMKEKMMKTLKERKEELLASGDDKAKLQSCMEGIQ